MPKKKKDKQTTHFEKSLDYISKEYLEFIDKYNSFRELFDDLCWESAHLDEKYCNDINDLEMTIKLLDRAFVRINETKDGRK